MKNDSVATLAFQLAAFFKYLNELFLLVMFFFFGGDSGVLGGASEAVEV